MAAVRVGGTTVAVMQPYFFPALSYFNLVSAVDIFVFLDDVQFVTKRWTHRNRIQANGQPLLFSVPLSGRSQNLTLQQISLGEQYPAWRAGFTETLRHNYGGGGQAAQMIADIDRLLQDSERETIADLAANTVRFVAERLDTQPVWRKASEIENTQKLRGADRIVAICKQLGASRYVNMPGGKALYDSDHFASESIELAFIEPEADASELSIIHELLRFPAAELAQMAAAYRLTNRVN